MWLVGYRRVYGEKQKQKNISRSVEIEFSANVLDGQVHKHVLQKPLRKLSKAMAITMHNKYWEREAILTRELCFFMCHCQSVWSTTKAFGKNKKQNNKTAETFNDLNFKQIHVRRKPSISFNTKAL